MSASPTTRIAIVDDDERVLNSLESLLSAYGYAVQVYLSGEAFVASEAVLHADCVISDVGMPGMNGFEVLAFAQGSRPTLPVILITARHEEHLSQQALRSGARYFFEKPFDTRALIAALAALLGARPAQ